MRCERANMTPGDPKVPKGPGVIRKQRGTLRKVVTLVTHRGATAACKVVVKSRLLAAITTGEKTRP